MTRAALLDLLQSLDPLTPAACLIVLWSYYEPRLGEVENGLRRAGIHPLRLRPEPAAGATLTAAVLAARLQRLRALVDEEAKFDEAALSLLKGLDGALHRISAAAGGLEFPGADGVRYRLWPRNNFIADTYEGRGDEVTWAAHQGLSMAAYARHFLVLPVGLPAQMRVESRRLRDIDRYLDSRVRLERERQRLRIMLWPLAVRIDYPALDGMNTSPALVSLSDPRNEDALWLDVEQAIDEARRREVTVLILPELAIPPAVARATRQKLAEGRGDGYPILTVLGLCHARLGDEDVYVNEAVLLGPDGSEVHRHRKMTPFSVGHEYPSGERINTGDVVTVLESAVGNVSVLICLDLFHDRVRGVLSRSHANLLLVPSLSPSTTAHRTRATDLGAARLASTFVSNRWLFEATSPEERLQRASFYRIPRGAGGEAIHALGAQSYLLFEL